MKFAELDPIEQRMVGGKIPDIRTAMGRIITGDFAKARKLCSNDETVSGVIGAVQRWARFGMVFDEFQNVTRECIDIYRNFDGSYSIEIPISGAYVDNGLRMIFDLSLADGAADLKLRDLTT